MILSDGVLKKSVNWELFPPYPIEQWKVSPAGGLSSYYFSTYAALYTQQLWVYTVVNKLAMGMARLPLKVYEHDALNRPDASASPYGRLLASPSTRMPRFNFWHWVSSTYDVYGEAFLLKRRDRGGVPIELIPLHPTLVFDETGDDGVTRWYFRKGTTEIQIPRYDLVHFRTYNPSTGLRGLSKLEPLRRTLEFEDAAQRAQSSFWRKGARPGVALTHPGNITQPAADRLKIQWDSIAAGADNTGTTVVLEEGMKPEVLTISANEAQYIDSRRLNREEVCGVYDMPPPAVHINDHSTYSNITEQMRSVYRDTHAPRLTFIQDTLESELRASVFPGRDEPDFGDDNYAEFLLDEVLRGDFEARAAAYQAADYMSIAEKRRSENLPFIDGTDRLFVNAANVPLDASAFNLVGVLVRAGYDPESVLSTIGLPAIAHTGNLPVTVQAEDDNQPALPAMTGRTLMGRLAKKKQLTDVDIERLVEGIEDDHASIVKHALVLSIGNGDSVAVFRARLADMVKDA